MAELNLENLAEVSGGAGKIVAGEIHFINYTVRSGDSLSAIASRFGTTVADICRRNGIQNANKIQAGKTLKIAATKNYFR